MHSNERTLRALRAQVQFELAEVADEVARAATSSIRAQEQVTASSHRCESAASEVRAALRRAHINPPLVDAVRRHYQIEARTLQGWQIRLTTAKEQEQRARTALASVRNRERSLERAMHAERRRQQRDRQTLDDREADDLWLQQAWQEVS